MALKVLGILGSPCKDGNTASLLNAVLDGAREAGAETERMDLVDLTVNPCMECRECDSGKGCRQHNDDMTAIYRKIREVDAIVMASPIFFMGVTAQMKAMIDRCQCFWIERYLQHIRVYDGRRRPKGLFVSCAGSPKPQTFEPAIHVVKAFFAAIDYEYAGEVVLGHTDDPELGSRSSGVLEAARAAGRKICEQP